MKIEDKFQEIDGIIKELELNEVTLEESFELYKKGMDIIKVCNQEIEKVEKQIIVLQDESEQEKDS